MKRIPARELAFMALCVAIGLVSKRIVSPVTNLLTDLISIPGGSAAVGFTLAFLIIGKLMVSFPAAATAMGFVQALLRWRSAWRETREPSRWSATRCRAR